MNNVITLTGVTRVLQSEEIPVTLVSDASLTVKAGEFLGIRGTSGSGKSSLLYLMGLLDQPTSGRINIAGIDVSTATEKVRQETRLEKIGFVFQFHFLLQEFSALDNVMLPMRRLGKLSDADMRTRAEKLLVSLGLEGKTRKKPGQMSGGERQRVAIARALANAPMVILADEPTGNLDSKNTAAVIDIFRKLAHETGVAVVAVTHDTEFATKTDRNIVMKDGKIVEEQ
ncbi:MAG: ABC transporter ATP-binding protein [Alphaproteobacteria bacterium]|nr:ABC transporter ATP-binding protein [Alphaproteobacteria bacterium]